MAQKDLFDGVVSISMYVAATIFNDGEMQWLDVLSSLSIESGLRAVEICQTADNNSKKEIDTLSTTKEVRIAKREVSC